MTNPSDVEAAVSCLTGMAYMDLRSSREPAFQWLVGRSGTDDARQLRVAFTSYVEEVMSGPASPGYEPLLIERGDNPCIARIKAQTTLYVGRMKAAESRRMPEVVRAIRKLADPKRSRSSIVRQINVLYAALCETWAIRTVFTEAGLNDELFVRFLILTVQGESDALQCLLNSATLSAPHIRLPRGRKVSAASATHELFLETQAHWAARAFTYSPSEDDFVDAATRATRLEFPEDVFRPRAASRRLKARRMLADPSAIESGA